MSVIHDDDRFRLMIAARCVRALADAFEKPPPIVVRVFASTKSPPQVAVPDWFLEEVDRDNVRLGDDGDAASGISKVGIYLDAITPLADGEITISVWEVYSLSQKFLHEFRVSLKGGQITDVVLARTTEL